MARGETVHFEVAKEKATKQFIRYNVVDNESGIVGTLYVPKEDAKEYDKGAVQLTLRGEAKAKTKTEAGDIELTPELLAKAAQILAKENGKKKVKK